MCQTLSGTDRDAPCSVPRSIVGGQTTPNTRLATDAWEGGCKIGRLAGARALAQRLTSFGEGSPLCHPDLFYVSFSNAGGGMTPTRGGHDELFLAKDRGWRPCHMEHGLYPHRKWRTWRPVAHGDLGVRHLEQTNTALLSKWVIRVMKPFSDMVSMLIHSLFWLKRVSNPMPRRLPCHYGPPGDFPACLAFLLAAAGRWGTFLVLGGWQVWAGMLGWRFPLPLRLRIRPGSHNTNNVDRCLDSDPILCFVWPEGGHLHVLTSLPAQPETDCGDSRRLATTPFQFFGQGGIPSPLRAGAPISRFSHLTLPGGVEATTSTKDSTLWLVTLVPPFDDESHAPSLVSGP